MNPRVVAANQCPDHATLARFRGRHQDAIAELFSQVLGLCVAELPGRKPAADSRKGKVRHANTTDPDSRMLRARNRFVQGYNAQAAVSEDQMVVAAEVTNAANDTTCFEPMVSAATEKLAAAGGQPVGAFVADAGYWSTDNASMSVEAEVLIAPIPATNGITDVHDPRLAQRQAILERLHTGELTIRRAAEEMGVSQTWARELLRAYRANGPDPAQIRSSMEERLATDTGAAAYAKRKITVEPVFGNLKANLRFRRFSQRSLQAVTSEWRLVCAVHNLLKLRRHQLTVAAI